MTRTNRDMVNSLSNSQLARLVVQYLPKIGRHWNDSVFGIASWLDSPEIKEEWDDIILQLSRRNPYA